MRQRCHLREQNVPFNVEDDRSGQAGMVPSDQALHVLAQVVPKAPPVSDLHSVGCTVD